MPDDGWTGGGRDGGAAEDVRNGLCRSERVPEPVPFVLVPVLLAFVFAAALAEGADEGEAELDPGK